MDIVVQTRLHAVNQWILIPLVIRGGEAVNMVLDTGAPLSAISNDTRDTLIAAGLLEPLRGNWYTLRGLSIQGQPIADLMVRISSRVTQARAEGLLGLDFLRQFTEIHFHVPTLRLTLTPP